MLFNYIISIFLFLFNLYIKATFLISDETNFLFFINFFKFLNFDVNKGPMLGQCDINFYNSLQIDKKYQHGGIKLMFGGKKFTWIPK